LLIDGCSIEENLNYIFFDCELSLKKWYVILNWLGIFVLSQITKVFNSINFVIYRFLMWSQKNVFVPCGWLPLGWF